MNGKTDLSTNRLLKKVGNKHGKIMVNALQKEGDKNYQKIIDSEVDLVNLDYPDKMIDLMKK